ncbi:MAG: hypothetical protein PHF46_04800, partial [Candidatus Gracilibacteria bacterium]|nr:hypothetical protein [Candidatus Gracilibacteria bacterium]
DTNHDNSGKKPEKQIEIIKSVLNDIKTLEKEGIEVNKTFKGFLVESYFFDGRQDFTNLSEIKKGLSLTDPCIGLEKTKELIDAFYNETGLKI